MKTCATCKWWIAHLDTGGIVLRAGSLTNAPPDFRLCARAQHRDAPLVATGEETLNIGIATAPDFGCTAWAPRD